MAPVPNKPTVFVDVKQHFHNEQKHVIQWTDKGLGPYDRLDWSCRAVRPGQPAPSARVPHHPREQMKGKFVGELFTTVVLFIICIIIVPSELACQVRGFHLIVGNRGCRMSETVAVGF